MIRDLYPIHNNVPYFERQDTIILTTILCQLEVVVLGYGTMENMIFIGPSMHSTIPMFIFILFQMLRR